MGISTSELDLYLPGGGSLSIGGADEAADIDQLNQNFQKIDTFAATTNSDISDLETADDVSVKYGNSTARDALYGVPGNDAQRAALANKHPLWFNTEFGWMESFYAVDGTSGLTAQGLVSGTAPGWYPVGEGPFSTLISSGSQTLSNGTDIVNWNNWGTDGSTRRGGDGWFTKSSGSVTCKKAGRYEVFGTFVRQSGTGDTTTHIFRAPGGSGAGSVYMDTTPLTSNASTVALRKGSVHTIADTVYTLHNATGSYTIFGVVGALEVRGEFTIRYKGPLLVTD